MARFEPSKGGIVPEIRLEIGEGEFAEAIRRNVTAWSLCMSLNEQFVACAPLADKLALPQLLPDTRRRFNTFRTWLGCSERGRGAQDPTAFPSAVAVSRFATAHNLLGTGCRSVANWFLIARAEGTGHRLMQDWYDDLALQWGRLTDPSRPESPERFWRYFEMDCSLTRLRAEDREVDEAIRSLAPFSVGNLGDVGTPHECLRQPVQFIKRRAGLVAATTVGSASSGEGGGPSVGGDEAALSTWTTPHTQWMLKLKGGGNQVDSDTYGAFLRAAAAAASPQPPAGGGAAEEPSGAPRFGTTTRTTSSGVPRILWLFWYQGEGDASLSSQDRLCLRGWRALNPGWEVRVLDAQSVSRWAAPVAKLWAGGTPEGALLQQKADLLRTYLLATYGGAWADTSVLPLRSLDSFLGAALANGRGLFAYAFPDPALSEDVSFIPHGN